jgi:hypothetical protein
VVKMDNDQNMQSQMPAQEGKGLAIASMVLGIVSLVLCCCFYYLAVPSSIVGLVLGIVSIKKGKPGKNMAIAGIIMSGIAVVFAIILVFAAGYIMSQLPWAEMLKQYQPK